MLRHLLFIILITGYSSAIIAQNTSGLWSFSVSGGFSAAKANLEGDSGFRPYLSEGASFEVLAKYGKSGSGYLGARFSHQNIRIGKIFSGITRLSVPVNRLEIPVGYSRRFDLNARHNLLLSGGISLDVFLPGSESFDGRLPSVESPINMNVILEDYARWERDRSFSAAVDIGVDLEHRMESGNVFFWGMRMHLSPFKVLDGSIGVVTSPGDPEQEDDFDYYGGYGNLHAGFRFGKTAFGASKEVSRAGKRTFFGELGGQGLLSSVNYDRRFFPFKQGNLSMAAHIGLGGGPVDLLTMPMGISLLTGQNNGHFEVGSGLTIAAFELFHESLGSDDSFFQMSVYPSVYAGYRLQKPEGGFFFRGVGHLMAIVPEGRLFPWAGIGAGYTLKK